MDNQNNVDTATEKPSKKSKVIVGIIVVCVAAVMAVVAIINFSVSPAEKVVKAFMRAFKDNNYHEMSQQCDIYAFDDEKLGI